MVEKWKLTEVEVEIRFTSTIFNGYDVPLSKQLYKDYISNIIMRHISGEVIGVLH